MRKRDKATQRIVKVARTTHPERHSQWVLDLGEGGSVDIVEAYHDLSRGSWVDSGVAYEAPEGKVRVVVHIGGDLFYGYNALAEQLHDARIEAEWMLAYEEEGLRIMAEERG